MRGRGFRWMNIYVTSNATPIHRISETNTCAWKIKNWETAPLQWYFFQEVYGTFSSAPGRIVSPVLEDCSFTGYTVWYSPFECFKRSFWSSLISNFLQPCPSTKDTPHMRMLPLSNPGWNIYPFPQIQCEHPASDLWHLATYDHQGTGGRRVHLERQFISRKGAEGAGCCLFRMLFNSLTYH